MKQLFLILLTCFSLASFSQPLIGIIASSQNNAAMVVSAQNLLTYSELLDDATWAKTSATVLANQQNDLTGGLTMDQITITDGNNAELRYSRGGNALVTVPGTTYYLSFDVKRGTATEAKYAIYNSTAGTWITVSTSFYAQTSASVSRITKSFTAPTGCIKVSIYLLKGGDGSIGTIFLGRVQVSTDTNAPYVATTTTNVP